MKKAIFLSFAFIMAAVSRTEAKLWINEIMQSNIDFLFAEGDYPDSWVEIYNDGDEAFRFINYRIGDSKDFTKAYPLNSAGGIGAKDYSVIYCDKVGEGAHTDFRIDSGKGELYLFSPRGEILDHISYPKMAAPNVAYGRTEDGGDTWGFELVATPRESNRGGVTSVVLPDPVFSVKGGVRYNDPSEIEVVVTVPGKGDLPADTRLYVTTDGKEPDLSSDSYDTEAVIRIGSGESAVVRAKLISSEAISPRAVTHSYIYHPREVDLPIVSLCTDQNYLDDPDTGIWKNFEEDWRRPVNVEFFYEGGTECPINQLGEFRIHGGWSKNHSQKSLAVYSNKRFGTKNFSYPFWADKPEIEKSKSFVLRNGGNNFNTSRINDSFVQTLFGRNCSNLDWQAYSPAICYVNGNYYGVYALRQRSNEDYVEDSYDGLEDIDMWENWNELKAGSSSSLEEFKAVYENNPTYQQMESLIDVENFANLYVANAWATNTDFPGNNIVMWRPQEEGGKWRWIMKDTDFFASNSPDFNYFNFLLHTGSYNVGEGNASHAVKLFKVMTSFEEFRHRLLSSFFVYLGDFLRPSYTVDLIDEQRDALYPEYDAHLARYGYPTRFDQWVDRVDYLKYWSAARSEALPGIICKYFNLKTTIPISIDCGDNEVRVNGVKISTGDFAGKWPIDLAFTLKNEDENTGWKVITTDIKGIQHEYETVTNEYSADAFSNITSIHFEPCQISGVEEMEAADDSRVKINVGNGMIYLWADCIMEHVEVRDMSGRAILDINPFDSTYQINLPAKGVYVISIKLITGNRIVRKLIY